MIRAWRPWLRSLRGQLTLLAGAFLGAIVLAVVIVCLRERLFEHYVREQYPRLEGWSDEAARVLAARSSRPADIDRVGKKLEKLIEDSPESQRTDQPRGCQALERIYGGWMTDEDLDPDGLLARRLTTLQPEWVLWRIRRTLVAGSPQQRGRAVAWLQSIVWVPETHEQVVTLARHAHRRAETRGEEDLRRQAAAVLAQEGAEQPPR
jgi:hypothetical protein